MKICLIEPFHGGSHAAWAEEFARHSRHEVQLLTLSARRWKWRMHGGAVTLARQFMQSDFEADLLLASDMLDLTTFLALTRSKTAGLPTALYFHENQLTYPWSTNGADPRRQRAHYAFINYTSAMAADSVLFNSRFHLDSFLGQLPEFLAGFPDHNEPESVALIREKSRVLPLGLDLQRFDEHRPRQLRNPDRPPLILWNHRWEYDKNPDEFFRALFQLQAEGCSFELVVLGEAYHDRPPVFTEAQQRLGERIRHFGYAENFTDYANWLWQADLLPVTSHHDFFGASVVQAIYCHCTPLLPNRLAYPEHLPVNSRTRYLYADYDALLKQLRSMLERPQVVDEALPAHVARYDWQQQIGKYDDLFAGVQDNLVKSSLR
jgi:glycosyltransferase involved in cell wall biosynthesis